MKKLFVISVIIFIFLSSCKKEVIPELETVELTGITPTSVISGGTIINEGSGKIISCGVCWNTSPAPTIDNNKSSESSGSGSFTSNITGLQPATKYYIRAYATNDAGTAYGKELSFTTAGQSPIASSAVATEITSSGAKLAGTVSANYLSTQVSFEYGLTTTYGNTVASIPNTVDGNSDASVSGSITGLTPSTVYHFRIKATNSLGTSYSNDISFTTLSAIPVLTTAAITNNIGTSVTSGGNITFQGNSPVSQRGICWSSSAAPTIQNNKTASGTGTGTFTCSADGLTPGTAYHLRAYATNNEGTAYGNEVAFTTNAIPATLSTSPATGVNSTSATIVGNISNNGGAEITERGICWSKSHNPEVTNDKVISSYNDASFTILVSGLRGSTTYYARSYAINSAGTAYGNEISFTTNAPVFAMVNTYNAVSATTTSVNIGCNIVSDGGADVTARGVCWSTTSGPTIAGNKTSEGSGTGNFGSNITGLSADTKYYVRAYAVTSWGTSYGNEVTVRTYSGYITDFEGNYYFTLKIGTQLWMAENLRATRFSNGDPIPTTVPANTSIVSESTPKYQWAYNGEEINVPIYGRLYTGHVVTDTRNVCPTGWHVPSQTDWTTLTSYLSANGYGFGGVSINIAKSMSSTTTWIPNTGIGTSGAVGNDLNQNNSSGFNGFPGGSRSANGEFCCKGGTASWWSQTASSSDLIHYFILYIGQTVTEHNTTKHEAASIRCIKD